MLQQRHPPEIQQGLHSRVLARQKVNERPRHAKPARRQATHVCQGRLGGRH